MSRLEKLDLSGKLINNMKGLDGLKQLKVLHLDDSSIDNSFLYNVGVTSSLRVLSLRNSGLNGSLPEQGWCELVNLQALDLSDNDLKGMIPSCLGNLTSIQLLDLSRNQLSGNLALSPLSHLITLEYLFIIHNRFDIPIPFVSFFNHSKLKSLVGHVLEQISPSLANLTRLQYLALDNNQFEGNLPNSLSTLPLSVLDVSNNHISGKLPRWMGNMSSLRGIIMFSNHFEGPIPVEFCKLHDLNFLDLSDNNLSGFVPSCFNLSFLSHVHLNQNNFSGPMTHAKFRVKYAS
ncbi:hypothetical protein Acr_00g0060820 [Actinidia rufa]|uniref:Disease resistance R13L4/SHOC-2-like LRR domain-containing protein n=1 Tax=Actinidia rufa TaxID=165716 RepID=A0A7J0DPY7_9ERIC|nr:hypothetical protein Acr_00g0060820 [Actinidia rufa]